MEPIHYIIFALLFGYGLPFMLLAHHGDKQRNRANRMEEAIRQIADRFEDGAWSGAREDIDNILNGKH